MKKMLILCSALMITAGVSAKTQELSHTKDIDERDLKAMEEKRPAGANRTISHEYDEDSTIQGPSKSEAQKEELFDETDYAESNEKSSPTEKDK